MTNELYFPTDFAKSVVRRARTEQRRRRRWAAVACAAMVMVIGGGWLVRPVGRPAPALSAECPWGSSFVLSGSESGDTFASNDPFR